MAFPLIVIMMKKQPYCLQPAVLLYIFFMLRLIRDRLAKTGVWYYNNSYGVVAIWIRNCLTVFVVLKLKVVKFFESEFVVFLFTYKKRIRNGLEQWNKRSLVPFRYNIENGITLNMLKILSLRKMHDLVILFCTKYPV